jgi:hypothetical protein
MSALPQLSFEEYRAVLRNVFTTRVPARGSSKEIEICCELLIRFVVHRSAECILGFRRCAGRS